MGVDDESTVLVDEAQNRITWNGMAAGCQFHHNAFGSADGDGLRVWHPAGFVAHQMKQLVSDHHGRLAAKADVCIQLVNPLAACFASKLLQH